MLPFSFPACFLSILKLTEGLTMFLYEMIWYTPAFIKTINLPFLFFFNNGNVILLFLPSCAAMTFASGAFFVCISIYLYGLPKQDTSRLTWKDTNLEDKQKLISVWGADWHQTFLCWTRIKEAFPHLRLELDLLCVDVIRWNRELSLWILWRILVGFLFL